MFGQKLFDGVGYPTPSSVPTDLACRMVSIPASADWLAVVMGALTALTEEDAWQQLDGGITAEDAAAAALDIVDSAYASADTGVDACAGANTSPFWDDVDAADSDGSPTDNTYTWDDQVADWAIAAFVASAGVPGAAVEYLTIAPRFRLLFKTRDWGGIAKIFIDGTLVTEVDTYSAVDGTTFVDILAEAV